MNQRGRPDWRSLLGIIVLTVALCAVLGGMAMVGIHSGFFHFWGSLFLFLLSD